MLRILGALLLGLTLRPGVRYTDWRWRFIAGTRRHLDRGRCAECHGNGRALHVHHLRPVSEGGNYLLWNLLTLCARCHEQRHGWDIDGDGVVAGRVTVGGRPVRLK